MPLTKEQLLIPRYKVIGKIPFLSKEDSALYEIGTIITDDGIRPAINSNGDPVFITEWNEYAHIFQPLPWWSDRKADEMPEYVKDEYRVIYRARWTDNPLRMYLDNDKNSWLATDKIMCFYSPAIQEEYINQKPQ